MRLPYTHRQVGTTNTLVLEKDYMAEVVIDRAVPSEKYKDRDVEITGQDVESPRWSDWW